MNTLKVTIFALILATACARPQKFDNFDYQDDDDLDEDGNFDAEVIQELAARDLYDLNPTYRFEYQVADEDEQTYIKHQEARDNDVVTGEYSYVDPLGSLIIVKYTAGADGYQETREVQPNFVSIRAKVDKPAVVPAPVAVKPAPRPVVKPVVKVEPAPQSNEDLIAQIIAQLTPFIKSTVSNSLGSSASTISTTVVKPTTVRRVPVVRPAPRVVAQPQAVDALTNVFGTGGTNNIRVETPHFNFAHDLQK